MKEGQPAIYYLTAASREAAERSPHLEAFRARGYEVLFFLDPIDELWLRLPREFEGKPLMSVARARSTSAPRRRGSRRRRRARRSSERFKDLLLALRAALQDDVKDVRLSERLTSSPACLVGEPGDLSAHLEELLRRSGQRSAEGEAGARAESVAPAADAAPGLPRGAPRRRALRVATRSCCYGQAILAEGGTLPDPAAFSRRLAELLVEAAGDH